MIDVAEQLLELSGGDRFGWVRELSEAHQLDHGCGLHNAGGPVVQLVGSIARAAGAKRVLDLGSGLGYSTLWLAHAIGRDGSVLGIDDDADHTAHARQIAQDAGFAATVTYETGKVADVLATLDGPFDLIHDDAWFASAPEHLEAMIALLRPGGVLTMANWFLLVDALTGQPRNDWASFAGPDWVAETKAYAKHLAQRSDIEINWITNPPVALATKLLR